MTINNSVVGISGWNKYTISLNTSDIRPVSKFSLGPYCLHKVIPDQYITIITVYLSEDDCDDVIFEYWPHCEEILCISSVADVTKEPILDKWIKKHEQLYTI